MEYENRFEYGLIAGILLVVIGAWTWMSLGERIYSHGVTAEAVEQAPATTLQK